MFIKAKRREVIVSLIDALTQDPCVHKCEPAALSKVRAGRMCRIADDQHVAGIPPWHPDVAVSREDQLVESCHRFNHLTGFRAESHQLTLDGVDPAGADRSQFTVSKAPVEAAATAPDREDAQKLTRAATDLVQLVANRRTRA